MNDRNITFSISGVSVEGKEESRLINLLEKEPWIIKKDINHDYNKVSRNGEKSFKEILLCNYKIGDNS